MPRQHNVFAEVGQNLLKSVFSKFVGISQRQFIVDWVWVSNAIFVKVALSGVLIRNYSQNNLASFLPVQWPALALTSTWMYIFVPNESMAVGVAANTD